MCAIVHSYSDAIHLFATRHLSRIPLRRAHLQTLIIPTLGTKLVQSLLLFTVRRGAFLATALARLNRLNDGGIVAVQCIPF